MTNHPELKFREVWHMVMPKSIPLENLTAEETALEKLSYSGTAQKSGSSETVFHSTPWRVQRGGL